MTITLIDARSTSLTVSWPAVEGATRYILEYQKVATTSDNGNDDNNNNDDDTFELLSDKLTQTQARKRNLIPNQSYMFRVAGVVNDTPGPWMFNGNDKKAFQTLSEENEKLSMEAPKAAHAGSNQALVISWSKPQEQEQQQPITYELQMRENSGGAEWTTIAPALSGTEVKKKNLTSKLGYSFRVRPSSDTKDEIPFSPPSDVVVARGLSTGIQRFFNALDDGTLLRSGVSQPIPLADALGGKEFVLLYASAHWCPPCRQFTPMLANWYKTPIAKTAVEIVFLSCDHDENGFKQYFATHPWMAVDYDDDARENLLAAIKVSGIPRLVVLSGKTGKIIEDNAVGKPFDLQRWRSLDK